MCITAAKSLVRYAKERGLNGECVVPTMEEEKFTVAREFHGKPRR